MPRPDENRLPSEEGRLDGRRDGEREGQREDQPEGQLLKAARELLGLDVEPARGGFSGETFDVRVAGERMVLRLYVRRPERAAVDAALLHRLRRVLPVPEVLEARTIASDVRHPPFLLTRRLPGQRLDLVLPDASGVLAAAFGRAAGSTLALVGTQVFARPGEFRDDALDPDPDRAPPDLESWALDRLGGLWAEGELMHLVEVARRVQPLADAVSDEARLVHSDFNPKNLLVDPATGAVTGLLDWEFAYSGSPLADVGNLLRFEPRPEFAQAFLDEFAARAGPLPEDWLAIARTLDLFALIELAGRIGENPYADAAADLLHAVAATGDLAAGRPRYVIGR